MERLILCGGGHVSLEVAHIARRLEFELVIIDDRPEFASRDRFPMAGQVVCAPFLEALDALGSRESDYYVILTRGHAHDRDCLEHVLRGKYAYAGMIGSRTKVAAVKAALEAAGIAREILDGVHSPIGLPIGAQTPAEIAVSIVVEHGGSGSELAAIAADILSYYFSSQGTREEIPRENTLVR